MRGRTTRRLTGHDRAASSIIGAKILVAFTVIISLPVGAYALDMSGVLHRPAPAASFDVTTDAADNVVTIRHTGGDTLAAHNAKVVVTNGTHTLVYRSGDPAPLSTDESFSIDTNTTEFSGWSGASFAVQSPSTPTPTAGGDDDDDGDDDGDGDDEDDGDDDGDDGDDDDGDDGDDDDDDDEADTGDSTNGFVFSSGDRITVKIIDTDGQNVVLETTIDV